MIDRRKQFEALIPQAQEIMARMVARRVPPDDVADVVQSALLAAWQNIDGFKGKSAMTTWLIRIALNKAVNHTIAGARRSEHETGDDELAYALDEQQPDLDAEAAELDAALQAVSVPPLYHEPLLLSVSGASYEEISEVVGIPVGTVRSRIYRARQILRQGLQSCGG